MKSPLVIFLAPLCVFGSEIKKDYHSMLESFKEYENLPLKEEKKEYFREFWDRSIWDAYYQKNPEALTQSLELSGFDVSVSGLIELFQFRPLPFSEQDPERNLDHYKKGSLSLISTPVGDQLSTDSSKSILILHVHENWKHLFYKEDDRLVQLHLIKQGTLTRSKIERIGLEPADADNPDYPPQNSKNQLDD
ncbi:hypothetical protein [Puniceicoccus vermicola]|uniref:Uncharacterized protein n=1 Tax=Puniceicoccus vermicola TaxID=388746 RepID=A0A7X1AVK3_9BACT|nr:hypothetical protein [Puniceicoccus vermicola]MBC2600632.1 hypothetical protein [Puniceicoccus vermicola]